MGCGAHRALPTSRLEVLEGVGHFLAMEAPDRVAEVLIDFLATTEAAEVTDDSWRTLMATWRAPDPAPSAG